MNSAARRVERLELAAGVGGRPCVLCERRASGDDSSPILREGFAENPGASYELNCPGCGSPYTFQIVFVEPMEAA